MNETTDLPPDAEDICICGDRMGSGSWTCRHGGCCRSMADYYSEGTMTETTPRDPAEAERAAEARIVAWLRERVAVFRRLETICQGEQARYSCREQAHAIKDAADEIEAGEHRKEQRDGR